MASLQTYGKHSRRHIFKSVVWIKKISASKFSFWTILCAHIKITVTSTPQNPNNYTFSSLLFCGKVGYVTILIEREEGEGGRWPGREEQGCQSAQSQKGWVRTIGIVVKWSRYIHKSDVGLQTDVCRGWKKWLSNLLLHPSLWLLVPGLSSQFLL